LFGPGPKNSWPGELLLDDLGDQIYHLTLRNTTVRTLTWSTTQHSRKHRR
jgi:hypothetical protein